MPITSHINFKGNFGFTSGSLGEMGCVVLFVELRRFPVGCVVCTGVGSRGGGLRGVLGSTGGGLGFVLGLTGGGVGL